jgi:hypothetical protein
MYPNLRMAYSVCNYDSNLPLKKPIDVNLGKKVDNMKRKITVTGGHSSGHLLRLHLEITI